LLYNISSKSMKFVRADTISFLGAAACWLLISNVNKCYIVKVHEYEYNDLV